MRKALLLAGVLFASLLPAGTAQAAPAIALINPSNYSSVPQVSDEPDADGTYHLVATVADTPASPLVEFELQGAGNPITVDATRIGSSGTWEANLSLDGISDGTYSVLAILYSGTTQVAESAPVQVTTTSQSSTAPPPAETVEIIYPTNQGPVGFFTPAGEQPNTLIDYKTSAGAQAVRGFYSTTGAGQPPEWTSCGTSRPNAEDTGRLRCTLAEGAASGQVRAIALVANSTPSPGAPNPTADESGDAHRVNPYTQTAASVVVTPANTSVDPVGQCLDLQATVADESGRPIAGANVDVHASGPNDQLQFATTGDSDDYQASDKNHGNIQEAQDCLDSGPLFGDEQANHRRPGQPDDKHIESVDNTSNNGVFNFALQSDAEGGSQVVAWADADDDDQLDNSETAGGTTVGWGTAAPPAARTLSLQPGDSRAGAGDCKKLTAKVRQGGAPSMGANVDVHLSGSPTVNFCTVEGGSEMQPPDGGEHVGDADTDDGSRHREATSSGNGTVTFGVTAATNGEVSALVWVDEDDDDADPTLSEPQDLATVDFGGARGDRRVSLKATERSGNKVRFKGRVRGDNGCIKGQKVKLQKKKGGKFKTVARDRTNRKGRYGMTKKVGRSRKFRAVVPRTNSCRRDASRTVRAG